MNANQPASPAAPVLHRVGQNLYRLASSGTYYALFKRSGKQIRKCLKTTDAAIARRRLKDLGEKVSRLAKVDGAISLTFSELAKRWLGSKEVNLKPASTSRLDVCIHGLDPYFKGLAVRSITTRHCEEWMAKRGKAIAAQSYKHERRTLIAIMDYAIREGLILDNPARISLPTRKIPKPKLVIPTQQQFKLLVETMKGS